MRSALQQFRSNLQRARELGTLAVAVTQITTPAIDVSDMWRAQIVLGVSALDYLEPVRKPAIFRQAEETG